MIFIFTFQVHRRALAVLGARLAIRIPRMVGTISERGNGARRDRDVDAESGFGRRFGSLSTGFAGEVEVIKLSLVERDRNGDIPRESPRTMQHAT